MKKAIDLVLVIGFLFVDWLMFHDIFKAGESHTTVEWIVGILSILVIARSAKSLVRG